MAVQQQHKDMLYRRLGNSGLFVSVFGLGGWMTYGGYVGKEKAFACMKQAYECGINFFDTAEVYADGESEIVMGEAIRKYGWKRSDLVVSTKLYWGTGNGQNPITNNGLSRKHIIEGTRASLDRLGLEYVDLIYAHRPDRLTPIEETVRAFNFVIEKGWAFYWGTSEWSADEIQEACGIAKSLGLIAPIVEQPCYNMLERQLVEGEYQRLYARCRLGLTTYSPMQMGLLSGKYNNAHDAPPPGSRFAESQDDYALTIRGRYGNDWWSSMIQKINKLTALSERLGFKMSQLALAWCLKNENVTAVITGASRPEQIVDNIQSLKILPMLTAEIMAEIDEVLGNKPALAPARLG
ncbi:hypothetical protein RU639_001292 [Aspergillus parasiticus]